MAVKNLVADISSHQPDSLAYIQALKNRGCKGVVIKLTENTNYTNPKAANQIRYSQQCKMKVSVYHFARFSTVAKAQSEANYFLQAIKNHNINTNAVVVCDYEAGSGSAGASQINAFYQVLENAGYKNVCIYSSRSWFQGQLAGTRGLQWVAEYGVSQCSIKCDMWQYSSSNVIGGATTDLNFDYNGIFSDDTITGNNQPSSSDDNEKREENNQQTQADATKIAECYSLLNIMNDQLFDKWLY